MLVITPYWSSGTWVFDDPGRGLTREPFVSGVPEMIDALVQDAGLSLEDSRRNGFRLLFSANPFPGYQKSFARTRADYGGTWYRLDDTKASPDAKVVEGWLCPALFKYFPEAPEKIYARAEPLR